VRERESERERGGEIKIKIRVIIILPRITYHMLAVVRDQTFMRIGFGGYI